MKLPNSFTKVVGLVALLQYSTSGFAQLSIAPRLGLQIAHLNLSASSPTVSSRLGMSAGVTANIRLGRCSLQPALVYVQRGAKVADKGGWVSIYTSNGYSTTRYRTSTADYRLDYLEIPFNLVYTAEDEETGNGFQTLIGPYIAFGVEGSVDVKTEDRNLKDGPVIETKTEKQDILYANNITQGMASGQYLRALDAGGQIGLGYRYSRLQLQALYQLGLVSTRPTVMGKKAGSENFHRVIQVNLNYFLNSPRD